MTTPSAWLGPLALLVSGLAPPVSRSDATGPPAPVKDAREAPQYQVLFVGNGDTVSLRMDDNQVKKVRLLGVSARKESIPFLEKLLAGRVVKAVIVSTDPSDRNVLLADLYRPTDGLFINLEMIRQGYGSVSKASFPDKDRFQAQEREARENRRGLWDPDAPKISPPPVNLVSAPATDLIGRPRVKPAYRTSRQPDIASLVGQSFLSFQPVAPPPPAWPTPSQYIPPPPIYTPPVYDQPPPTPIYPLPWPPPPRPCPPPIPPPCPPGPPVAQPVIPGPTKPVTPVPSPPTAPPPPVISTAPPIAIPRVVSQPTPGLPGNPGGSNSYSHNWR